MRRTPRTYRRFWNALLDRPAAATPLHERVNVVGAYKMGAPVGVDNIRFAYAIKFNRSHAQLLRRGYANETAQDQRRSYNKLVRRRAEIHARFGGTLEWRPPAGSRNWHVVAPLDGGGLYDVERWPEI